MNKLIVCSPSPVNGGWRLHWSQELHDSIVTEHPCEHLILVLEDRTIEVDNLTNYMTVGHGAIYNHELSDWIIEKGFIHQPHQEHPKRLLFNLIIDEEAQIHSFKYFGFISDCQFMGLPF